MNAIVWALLGTLFTFSVTTLGALNVFWVKKEISNTFQGIFLGFAGGVMIASLGLVPSFCPEFKEQKKTDRSAGSSSAEDFCWASSFSSLRIIYCKSAVKNGCQTGE